MSSSAQASRAAMGGRLDAGRRRALLERIAVSREHLVDLADAVESDLGRC